MVTFDELVKLGNALARAIGHTPGCPKLSPAIPCICDAGRQQAKALDEWLQAVKEIKESGII